MRFPFLKVRGHGTGLGNMLKVALLWAAGGLALAAPTITRQPAALSAYETQTATFTVEATGTGTLSYQWRRGNDPIGSATNSSLVLTNVTLASSGSYSVQVTDTSGSTASEAVLLTVLERPYPTLQFGTYEAGATATAPVRILAQGGETRVRFTVGFNPEVLTNARFTPVTGSVVTGRERAGAPSGDEGATMAVTEDRSQVGRLGVEVVIAEGGALVPGLNALGTVAFDAVAGAGRYGGGVHFTNVPVALEAGPASGTNLIALAGLIGPVVRVLGAPVLNGQSGLFLQRVEIGNPGISTQLQVRVTVSGLTNDSLGVPIRLYNSLGSDTNGAALVYSADLPPGASRELGLEYYVADLTTVPTPVISSDSVEVIAGPRTASRTLAVDRAQYVTDPAFGGGAFLIEFPTEKGRNYFVQYAPTMEAFTQDRSQIRTARPAIPGTGSRVQWIDHGAPKTESAPTDGARFYRIILGF